MPTLKDVEACYLMLMEKNGEFSHLLVVDTNNPSTVFPIIGNKCSQSLEGMYLDMVDVKDNFGTQAIQNKEPIYTKKKKRFGFF